MIHSSKFWLIHLLRYIVGSVFFIAGISKLFPLKDFFKQLITYQLPVPDIYLYFFSVILISLEVCVGLAIILNLNLRRSLFIAQILLAFMIPITIWGSMHKAPTCGCYGNLIRRDPWIATIEDILLLTVSLLLVPSINEEESLNETQSNSSSKKSFLQSILSTKMIAVILATLSAATYGFIQLNQVLSFRAEQLL